MDKPLIIKCNCMFTDKEIEEYRQKIMSQMKDEVVILSPGFELTDVNVGLLEDIKAEIVKEIIEPNDIDCFENSNVCQKWFLNLLDKHFDKHIKENKQ